MVRHERTVLAILIALQLPAAAHTVETDAAWEKEIEVRRAEYLDRVVEQFGKLEPNMKPLDGRAWSLIKRGSF